MGKGGLACAAPFPKSCAQIRAQDNGRLIYNRPNQQNFIITKFIVDYYLSSLTGLSNSAGIRLRPAGYAETGTPAGGSLQGIMLRAFRARALSVVLASLIPRQRRRNQHFVDCKL